MNKLKWVSLILVLTFVSMACQLFSPTSDKDGVVTGDPNRAFAEQPSYDPEAPLPSPGAASLRVLAAWEPGAAELQADVEAAELAALNALINELSPKTGSNDAHPLATEQAEGARVANLAPKFSISVSYRNTGNLNGAIDTTHDVSLIAGLITGLGDILTEDMPAGASVSPTATKKEGDTTTTMSADIGKSADGSSKFGLGLQTETSKDAGTTSTDFAASVDGQRCPNVEGQVSFTVKVRLGAVSNGNGFTQDLTAFVRAVVGDDAQIASTTFDILEGTRQVKNGREVYIETGHTVKFNGDDMESLEYSNVRMIRHSQNATQADASEISGQSNEAALAMARTALLVAQQNWRTGGCVKIEAASPGTIQTGSRTQIEVTVMHRFDGSVISSKLEAVLAGETSIDPTSLAKTPGTLTYTAPGEGGKSATIKLTATSRRGMATLDLTANTGGAAYRIVGGLDDWQTDSVVCDIMKPFTLTGNGITMQVSGGLTGTYTYSGLFSSLGQGTYTISLPDGLGKPGTMTGGGVGSAEGYSNNGTESYTLTPLDAAAGCGP